jgi:hypothetical protein
MGRKKLEGHEGKVLGVEINVLPKGRVCVRGISDHSIY